MIISRSILLKMRNVSDERYRQNQNTDICSSKFSENPAVNVKMWKNIVVPGRPHMRIRHLRIASWVPKAKNTQSEYVILVVFHCNNGYTNAPQSYVILYCCSFLFQSLVSCQDLWQCNVLEEYNTAILRVEEMGSMYSYVPPKHL
jgi:hypothetical protein